MKYFIDKDPFLHGTTTCTIIKEPCEVHKWINKRMQPENEMGTKLKTPKKLTVNSSPYAPFKIGFTPGTLPDYDT